MTEYSFCCGFFFFPKISPLLRNDFKNWHYAEKEKNKTKQKERKFPVALIFALLANF